MNKQHPTVSFWGSALAAEGKVKLPFCAEKGRAAGSAGPVQAPGTGGSWTLSVQLQLCLPGATIRITQLQQFTSLHFKYRLQWGYQVEKIESVLCFSSIPPFH